MKIKLEEDKKVLHKSYTVIFSVFLIILSILEIIQPYVAFLESVIPANVFPWVTAGLGITIAIGRYIKQDLSDGKLDGVVGHGALGSQKEDGSQEEDTENDSKD